MSNGGSGAGASIGDPNIKVLVCVLGLWVSQRNHSDALGPIAIPFDGMVSSIRGF